MDANFPDWDRVVSGVHPAVDLLECALRDQAVLCDALESVADRLPDKVAHGECLHLRRAIPPILAAVHRQEEEAILPWMAQRWQTPSGLAEILDHIRYEQLEEECYAEELCDALRAYGTGLVKPSPETLGYILRGYFDCARRRIRFDCTVLLPMLSAAPALTV
ncbi:hemerythrin domain-containing protein [Pararhizobium sp.]|uniref:hemerythrin domain-containing protein n=1 Tax=Pararhizobium sp. TaxID=1977563 RepID=UPI003D0F9A88